MFTKLNQKALLGVLAVLLLVFVAVGCSNEMEQSVEEGEVLVNFAVDEVVENYYEDEVVIETVEYEVYENDGTIKDSSEVEIADSDSISFAIDGVTENNDYDILVTALDEAGETLFVGEEEVLYSGEMETIYIDAEIPSSIESNEIEVENIDSDTIKVYYDSAWSDTYMHYGLDGDDWTDVPGEEMGESAEFPDYEVIEVDVDNASFVEAAFNDGGDNWDNNDEENYYIDEEIVTVENGTVNYGNPDGETDDSDDEDGDEDDEDDDVEIYYQATSAPEIWIWEDDGDDISEEMGHEWPGPEMEEVTDAEDWYLFEIPAEYLTGAPLEFHFEGDNSEVIERGSNESGWYDGSEWHTENPDEDDEDLKDEVPEDQVNETMYQAFYWESYEGLWSDITANSNEYVDVERLAEAGITSMWLPPAAKASNGTDDVGYAVYDFWDLGEFEQHGTVETRYGTRAELEDAIGKLDDLGIESYFDVVFNHRMGGAQETAPTDDGETIESYTDMTLEGRAANYSGADQFDWNWEEFNAVDWCAEDGEIGATLFENKYWGNTYSDAYLMGNDVDYNQGRVIDEMNEWGEWITNKIGFAGFRMDAIAHVDSDFTDQWLDHVQAATDEDTFFVAEAWVGDVEGYLDHVGNNNLMAFDFELREDFVDMSDGEKDMRWWGGLINSNRAEQAVTFIDNHDTSREGNPYGQPQVTNFKNQAYAYILMREHGVPTVYARDYDEFGMADTLDKMIEARKDYAYGTGHEVENNDYHTYSYVREGLDNVAETGLVMMISDSEDGATTTKEINSRQPDTEFYDYTGNVDGTVTTDSDGYGNFEVREEENNGWSIWVPTN